MSKIPRPDIETVGTLHEIFTLLRLARGIDFGDYKQGTIGRRIARRMALSHIEDLPDYLRLLRADRGELDALYDDLLITVTTFFRDPEVFDFLKIHIIPEILTHIPPDTSARVWVPGCASGEEVYSIAICFVETAPDRNPPVQIFGTDISPKCISTGRHGLYRGKIKGSVSRERLRRFFVKEADDYRVSRVIRQMCIFAEQDVIRDTPFSKMDLVSCRNLLIYLDIPTQKKVLHNLYYALKPTGFLLLGVSESVAAAPELFAPVQKCQRIYSKVQTVKPVHFAPIMTRAGRNPLY